MKRIIALLSIVVLVFAFATSCSSQAENEKSIKIGYVNWSEGIAITNLAKVVLEDRLGYEVELTMGDVGPIYASVASGDYDAFLDGWLPSLQKSYIDKFEDKFVMMNNIFEGTLVGLVVPAYVDIDSIDELNSIKDKFDSKIIGIDTGAGIMTSTEKAIEEYGLDFELVSGSGPVMTATLADAIPSEKFVVVTGWQPHWKFGKWDLKFLKDPKGVYGEPEYIKAVGRLGIKEDHPTFTAFIENYQLTADQLNGLMSMINDSSKTPYEVAKDWAAENSDVVDGWVKGIE